MTKFLNISTDNTLGGNSPSDVTVSSQKAIKEYVDSHGGGGSTAIDNLSITQNSSLQLQAIGVIDSNNTTNAIKTWTGTKQQYDAILSKDANTLYNITDDTDVTLTLLEALYPVGSIYITTANTCPLSALISGSTWELVSSGRVLQGADSNHAAGTTIEAGLPNISGWFADGSGDNSGLGNDYSYTQVDGCFGKTSIGTGKTLTSTSSSYDRGRIDFNASNSNSIYGNSNTVQPPAYVVNIYRRIS